MEKRRDEMRKKKGSKLLKAMSCSSKRGGVRSSDSNKSIEEILKSGLGTIMEEDLQDQQAPMNNVNVKKRHRIISRKFLSFRDMYMHFMAGFSSSRTQNFIAAGVAI